MADSIRDVYSRITGKIIADLEQGVRPWMKPWNAEHAAGRITRPLRHNGIPYKGINVVMLWSASVTKGYAAPFWLTFKQALELGGHVRKGESGELVVYADRITRTETNDKGEELMREIPFMKGYTVFNAEQCEDLPAHFTARVPSPLPCPRCSASMPPTGSLPRPAPLSATAARAPSTPKAPIMCRCRPSRLSAMPRATPPRWRMSSRTGRNMRSAWRGISGACGSAMKAMRKRNSSPSWVPPSSVPISRSPRRCATITPPISRHGSRPCVTTSGLIFTAAAHAQRAADYLHALQPQTASRRSGPPHRRPLPESVPPCPCPASSISTAAAISGATWSHCARHRPNPRRTAYPVRAS